MPLYRSAGLFTLGLALAGTCAAHNAQDDKQTHKQLKQQRVDKAMRRTANARLQRKAARVQVRKLDSGH